MMYTVQSNDGTTELDAILQNALARVLMEMTDKTRQLVITEMDLPPEDVVRDMSDGTVHILKDPSTFKHRTLVTNLSDEQVKAVLQLNFLAESAMVVRDGLLTSLFETILKPNSNEINYDQMQQDMQS